MSNQFKKLGFKKPKFECEILKVFDNYIIGYFKDNTILRACIWYRRNGVICSAYQQFNVGDKFNLIPRKSKQKNKKESAQK